MGRRKLTGSVDGPRGRSAPSISVSTVILVGVVAWITITYAARGAPGAILLLVGVVLYVVWRWWKAKVYRETLVRSFGEEAAENILARRFWEGATQAMIVEMMGAPSDVAESVHKGVRRETWKYSRIARGKYATKVEFEDGVCVGWERL